MADNEITAEFTPAVADWLAEHGYEPQYGARPLKRLILQTLIKELSKEMLADKIKKNDHILIDIVEEKFVFTLQPS